MPAQRKTNQSRRLTGAGLIAVTAATLLMMVWVIFPTAAFASPQSTTWDGKQGVNNLPCTGGSTLWILAGFGNQADDVNNVVLHVDNQTATMVKNGNEFRATVSGPGTTTPNAFATWDWNGVGDPPSPQLTISHCEGATTTPPPPEKARIEIEKQTVPNGDPATFGFTGEINTTLGDGQSDGKDVDAGTYTVSETALAGWTLTDITCNDNNSTDAGNTATFNVEAGETVRCVFTNTKDVTTTTTPPKGRIEIEKQTVPNGDPATFGFTGEINTTLGDGQSDGKDVDAGTYTVSETALAGWTLTDITCNDTNSTDAGSTATFRVEEGETVRCVFTNTKNATTTTPGGGGGGGGGVTTTTTTTTAATTTTTYPTVAPTTIHNTSTTPTNEVLPTTVRPGGTAFTGVENVVPIGAIALMLMTSGSGLLWAGTRRRRHDGSEDED